LADRLEHYCQFWEHSFNCLDEYRQELQAKESQ
jgi:hypothetical protein